MTRSFQLIKKFMPLSLFRWPREVFTNDAELFATFRKVPMESLNDALIACIKAAGGSKQVGPLLWPEKTPEAAQRQLLDCLNEERPAKLSPEQVLLVLRMARAKGYHDGMNFIAGELGYGTPVPVEPRDEVADLMRAFNEAVAQQAGLAARIEKAAARLNMRAVA